MTTTEQHPVTTDTPPPRGSSASFGERVKSIANFEITRKKVNRKVLMHFSRQLSVFVQAGVPLIEALESIQEEMGDKFFKDILVQVVQDLQSGSTFSQAMGVHADAFPTYYLGILRAAELTGRLDTSLNRLAEYVERDLEARRRITSALTYPAVVLVVALTAVAVLVGFVLPRFEKFFHSFNAKLPLATRILLDISKFLHTRWYLILGALILVGAVLFLASRTPNGRFQRDRLLLKIPAIGEVIRHAVLERFCRILSAMVEAGVPLPEALAVSSDAVSNSVYRRGLAAAREAMVRGEGLAAPLAATGLFPAAARQIFRVGEETGTLDDQLEMAAVFFDRELDYKLKRLTTIFEPAVIVFMGAVVGFVAIALISAMYGIFHQVKV